MARTRSRRINQRFLRLLTLIETTLQSATTDPLTVAKLIARVKLMIARTTAAKMLP